MKPAVTLAFSAIALYGQIAIADDFLEEITIVGERTDQKQISGAAQYIGQAQLEALSYSDIQRILRQAAGVSLQIEDGYGLRPNISKIGRASCRERV